MRDPGHYAHKQTVGLLLLCSGALMSVGLSDSRSKELGQGLGSRLRLRFHGIAALTAAIPQRTCRKDTESEISESNPSNPRALQLRNGALSLKQPIPYSIQTGTDVRALNPKPSLSRLKLTSLFPDHELPWHWHTLRRTAG